MRTHADTVLTRLQNDAVRFVILGAGILSVLMNWLTVSALGSVQTVIGFEYLVGKFYFFAILALIVIEFVATEYRHYAWLIGGPILSLVSIVSLLYIQARIDEAMASLGIFSTAVEASVGTGVYLAVIVALAITAVGYMNSEFGVNEYLENTRQERGPS